MSQTLNAVDAANADPIREVAAILAAGFLRSQDGRMSVDPHAGQKSEEAGLDLSGETRLSVTRG